MNAGRVVKIALVLAGLLFVVAVVIAALAVKPYARTLAVKEARDRGIELEFDDMTLGFGHVRIHNARFSLVGVPEIHGTIREPRERSWRAKIGWCSKFMDRDASPPRVLLLYFRRCSYRVVHHHDCHRTVQHSGRQTT